jgi:hypothetical protein
MCIERDNICLVLVVAAAAVVVVKMARGSLAEPNDTYIIAVPLYLLVGLRG